MCVHLGWTGIDLLMEQVGSTTRVDKQRNHEREIELGIDLRAAPVIGQDILVDYPELGASLAAWPISTLQLLQPIP